MKLFGALTVSMAVTLLAATPSFGEDKELEVDRADEWHFKAAPYVWMAGMDGDVTVKGFEASVDLDFSDILDVIDIGFIGAFEATHGRFSIISDVVYLKVSEDGDTPGPLISDIDVEVETLVLELGGAYLVHESESGLFNKPTTLEVLAGLRYTEIKGDLDITAAPPIADRSGSEDWVDPFIGFRTKLQCSPRWSTMFRADIGGFGVGSELVYQLELVEALKLNDSVDFVFGYRHLQYDYDDGSGANKFEFDVAFTGPLVGLVINF